MQKRQSQAEPKETEVRATAKFQRQADTWHVLRTEANLTHKNIPN